LEKRAQGATELPLDQDMQGTTATLGSPHVLEPNNALPTVALHPAPWQLRGSAYLLAVHMPGDVLDHAAFVPPSWVPRRRGRISYVAFFDYHESNCGPYRELLVAPAVFAFDSGTYPAISRIFVSTYDSVVNGRNNWGIPKDQADFTVHNDAERKTDLITASRDGHTFAELELRSFGPALPVTTGLLLRSLRTLLQPWQGKGYRITLSARGRVRMASLGRWRFDAEYFPDLARGRVLGAIQLPEFEMTFPLPEMTQLP
jgi:hypothetical protein